PVRRGVPAHRRGPPPRSRLGGGTLEPRQRSARARPDTGDRAALPGGPRRLRRRARAQARSRRHPEWPGHGARRAGPLARGAGQLRPGDRAGARLRAGARQSRQRARAARPLRRGARQLCRRARHRPDYAEACYNRGRTLHERGRFEEAIASYERALARAPGHADAHVNRGNALRELGRFEEALDSYAAARRAAPGHVDAHCNEGLCRLLLGDLRRGWDLYEWRWQQRVARPRRYTDYAAWQGEDVDGRLLAWSEQGPGDTMFFAGMIPDLIPRARRLVVQVEPRLAD